MHWNYFNPVRVVFGAGTAAQTSVLLRGMGVPLAALVAAPSALRLGLAQRVTSPAPELFTQPFSEIQPNPTRQNAEDCARFIRESGARAVVALGGGSTLDCAKAAAGGLPVVALPTTAGTGSEVTCISVLSDGGAKTPLVSPEYYPKIAVVDPELTLPCPAGVTAAAGMDALSHALEALWSIHHSPASDALALRAIPPLLQNIETAFARPEDYAARHAMSEGSLIAGLAFSQAKTAAVHACSFPLTARYGLSHGEACAFTLPAYCRLNAAAEGGRLHDIARLLGFADADALADELDRLNAALGLPRTLAQAGIPLAGLPALAEECLLPPNMQNNPVPMDRAGVVEVFESLA